MFYRKETGDPTANRHVLPDWRIVGNRMRTDELGFTGVENKTHVHDLQATIMHLLGFDHERLTYRFQGRDYRLTDVHGHVVQDWLA